MKSAKKMHFSSCVKEHIGEDISEVCSKDIFENVSDNKEKETICFDKNEICSESSVVGLEQEKWNQQ